MAHAACMIGAIITGGDIEILDFPHEHLEVPLIHLRESGGMFYRNGSRMIVRGGAWYPQAVGLEEGRGDTEVGTIGRLCSGIAKVIHIHL